MRQLLFTQQEYIPAAETYRQAIEKDDVREEAHRELMRCYARLGERSQALRHYQTFEQLIRDELGAPPTAESAAFYERLKRGEEVQLNSPGPSPEHCRMRQAERITMGVLREPALKYRTARAI